MLRVRSNVGQQAVNMSILVNGEPRTAPTGRTVAELLDDLDIQSERVAVELNLEIVDKADFGRRILKDGDRIEIMSFIGGGTVIPVPAVKALNDDWDVL